MMFYNWVNYILELCILARLHIKFLNLNISHRILNLQCVSHFWDSMTKYSKRKNDL